MTSDPKHRKKVKHYDVPGDAHFLTLSCYRRYRLLSKDRSRLWFIDALENARSKHGFHLWAWVIMPEHVHLLLWTPDADMKTDKILASIKKPVSYKATRYLKQYAPSFLEKLTVVNANRTYHRFWQPGAGWDQNLYNPPAVHNTIAYIHNNPVRRSLVKEPTDWFWSSARVWAGMEHSHIQGDATVPTLHPDCQ